MNLSEDLKFSLVKQIKDFLKTADKPAILAIVGPIGSGKTTFSIQIAKQISGEIINADSKQLYRGLEVTNGCISESEKHSIPHYLFSEVDPSQNFTVVQHRQAALSIIKKIHQRQHIPILVGGTGLFVQSLLENFNIPENSVDPLLRKKLEQKNKSELWQELQRVDPEYAKTTHENNQVRVIRALEVFYLTGQKKSYAQKKEKVFSELILLPKIENREKLYALINNRALKIWKNGLLEEAQQLLSRNLNENLPALKTIGIPEAFAFLRKEISEEEAILQMQKKSRNYAKRQMTWWRKQKNVVYWNI